VSESAEQRESAVRASLVALRWHERFHVRTALLFGAPVVVLLALLGALTHHAMVEREMDRLRSKLTGLSIGLAHVIDPEDVEHLRSSRDVGSPAYRRLRARLERVAHEQPDVKSLYVLRRGEGATQLRFALDWVRRGSAAQVGQAYDARQAPQMLRAFDAPAVEPRLYEDAWGLNLSGYAPLRDGRGVAVAIVGVDVDARYVDEIERRATVTTAALVGLALVLFVAGGMLLGRHVRRPLARIVETTSAIAAGDLGARTGLTRDDELGILAARIDRLALELRERDRLRAVFGRYVSEDVARRVLSEDAMNVPRTRDVTALFVDIRGYSTFSEQVPPGEVIEVLNTYFTAMLDVVDAHGGCVIELLGDAILAVFGAPDALDDHAAQAVRCALAMRERLVQLEAEWEADGHARLWKDRGLPSFAVRMGIHTDRVVAGSFGTDRRTKYAVLGRAVAGAMELEALNKVLDSTLLVSAPVLAALPDALRERATERGERSVRGTTFGLYAL
jgi:adenylate cyclase